jgi:histidyl-tRNA synthetase
MAQAHHLRINGISCDIDYLGRSLKAQMREADRQKVGFVMVIGEKELGERKATIRHMATGNQRTIPFDEILDVLNKHVQ